MYVCMYVCIYKLLLRPIRKFTCVSGRKYISVVVGMGACGLWRRATCEYLKWLDTVQPYVD